MGRILNIRVHAFTYNEEETGKAWPSLCGLVWPLWSEKLGLIKKAPRNMESPVEKALGSRSHGVLELVEALADGFKYADWQEGTRKIIEGHLDDIESCAAELNKALADWDAKKAELLSSKLEEFLSKAESALSANKD